MEIHEVLPAEAPLKLLLEADPSLEKINAYLPRSRCFVAHIEGKVVGTYVVLLIASEVYELMSIAVCSEQRKKGIGSKLLRHAVATVRGFGAQRIEVGTGIFGYQLAFYQKEGFRVFAVEREFFLMNYEKPIYEKGIQHKDLLRLALDFKP